MQYDIAIMQESWDDLRFVLAVARAGRLDGAAGLLGVDPSTVFRRLKACEARLDARLFDRRGGIYRATGEGQAVIAQAEAMEEASLALQRRLAGGDVRLSGTLRLTMADTLALGAMPGHLRAFRDRFPDIVVETVVSNALLSLSRREADIAIRPGNDPLQGSAMVGRRVATIAFALYGAPAYLTRHGRPAAPQAGLEGHLLIGFDESLAHVGPALWLGRHDAGARTVYRSQSLVHMASAARAGIGLALLPCFLADPEPALERLYFADGEAETGLWLITHEELRHTARVRAFLDFVAPRLVARRRLFDPRAAAPILT
jgi:DNA-binding transcriptional LysR family regulator